MKRTLLALLLALPMTGCISQGQLVSLLGIKPSPSVFGPCTQPRAEVWAACRDVLADEGYTFAEADRDDWHLETKWFGYGSGFFFGNKRYRITIDLVDGDSDHETFIEMVAEYERNSARDPLAPDEEAWEQIGADRDLEEMYAHMIRTRLTKRDIYLETYNRLKREERGKPKKPDYSAPAGENK